MTKDTTKTETVQAKLELCPLCKDCVESPVGRCPFCESQAILVELAMELTEACETAMRAGGQRGASVARLKTRLNVLTKDIAQEAGLL